MPSCRSTTKLWFSYKDSHQFHLKHNVFSCFLQNLCLSPNESHTFYKTSHVRIIMTVIIAARVLLLVQGFSSKVEWTAKMSHVSINMTAFNESRSASCIVFHRWYIRAHDVLSWGIWAISSSCVESRSASCIVFQRWYIRARNVFSVVHPSRM